MEHFIVHPAKGGLNSTQGPTHIPPDALRIATNIAYGVDGVRRKRPGTNRLNAAQVLDGGTAITFTGIADFWRYGASLAPVQSYIATGGTQVWRMTPGDATWTSIGTGWGSNTANTSITIGQGFAVFANDLNEAPQSWDQTTFAALAGSPPNFSMSRYHLRRLWYAGVPATPSTVNASAAGDITLHSGADYLTYVVDEDDGDRVVGLSQPWKRRIFVFKGPNKGSIHELAGLTAATITRDKIITGAPCISHNSIITTPNDIYWCSLYGFHSLRTTQEYGDTKEFFLSAPIQKDFDRLNTSRLGQIQSFWHPTQNVVGWLVPWAGQVQNTAVFLYNYALSQWSIWEFGGFNPSCAAVMRDPTSQRLYVGDYTGRVHSGDQDIRSDDDGTVSYAARIRTPIHIHLSDLASEMAEKQFYAATTFFKPKGDYNATLDTVVDGSSVGSFNVSMAGSGAIFGTAIFGTSRFGGSEIGYVETPFMARGRSVELTYTMSGANRDMELYGHAIRYEPAELNALEAS